MEGSVENPDNSERKELSPGPNNCRMVRLGDGKNVEICPRKKRSPRGPFIAGTTCETVRLANGKKEKKCVHFK